MTKAENSRRIKRSQTVNGAKSQLLGVLRDLESNGLAKDALRLSNMIGRLEEWQNS